MTVDMNRLHAKADPEAWADEFCKSLVTFIGDNEASRELLRGWFANAFDVARATERDRYGQGYEAGMRAASDRLAVPEPAVRRLPSVRPGYRRLRA